MAGPVLGLQVYRAGKLARVHGVFFLSIRNSAARHFFYGPTPSVISKLKDVLVKRYGNFKLVGTHCPRMQALELRRMKRCLLRFGTYKPHIIWVALSTQSRELWLHMHMHESAPVSERG